MHFFILTVRVGPEQITHGTVMRNLLFTVDRPYLLFARQSTIRGVTGC